MQGYQSLTEFCSTKVYQEKYPNMLELVRFRNVERPVIAPPDPPWYSTYTDYTGSSGQYIGPYTLP